MLGFMSIFSNKKFLSLFFGIFFRLVSIFIGLYMARWLDANLLPDDYKEYNLILVYNSIIIASISLGVASLFQKFYTNHQQDQDYELKKKEFFTTVSLFQFLLYLIGVVLVFIFFSLFSVKSFFIFLLLYTAQYILSVDGNFKSMADAFGNISKFTITDVFAKSVIILLLILLSFNSFVTSNDYIIAFSIILLLAYLLKILMSIWIFRKQIGLAKPNINVIQEHKWFFFHIGISSFLIGLYAITDRWFIEYFTSNTYMVNGYSNAYKLLEISLVLPAMSAPLFASELKKKIAPYNGILQDKVFLKWAALSTFFGILAFFVLIISSLFIIPIIYTNPLYFDYASESLFYLSFGVIPSGLVGFLGSYLVMSGGEKFELRIIAMNTMIILSLYFLLIPKYEHIGAAIANVTAAFFILIVRLYYLHKLSRYS